LVIGRQQRLLFPFFFELLNLEIRVDNLESEKKIKLEKTRKEYGMNLNLFERRF